MASHPLYMSCPGMGSSTTPSRNFLRSSPFSPRLSKYSSALLPLRLWWYRDVASIKKASCVLLGFCKLQALLSHDQIDNPTLHATSVTGESIEFKGYGSRSPCLRVERTETRDPRSVTTGWFPVREPLPQQGYDRRLRVHSNSSESRVCMSSMTTLRMPTPSSTVIFQLWL